MKALKTPLFTLIFALGAITVISCKSKKLVQKPVPVEKRTNLRAKAAACTGSKTCTKRNSAATAGKTKL